MAEVTRFGRYVVLGVLGRGGFATVYRARDTALGRDVALKALAPHLAEDAEVRRRFVQEAQRIAQLRHPHIVTVHDVGEADGQPFFTMELVEGETLAERGAAGPQSLELVVRILRNLGSAVDYVHAAGLIHRDIKAANVMLDAGGRVVLMDFGIVRALDGTQFTNSGMTLGTPEAMSPEQVLGNAIGPASDIYALGVLAYHLLAGRPPFSGEPLRVMYAHAHDTPPSLESIRPDLPPAVYAAIHTAMAKSPAERPPTASALARQLRGEPQATPAERAAQRARTARIRQLPRQTRPAGGAVAVEDLPATVRELPVAAAQRVSPDSRLAGAVAPARRQAPPARHAALPTPIPLNDAIRPEHSLEAKRAGGVWLQHRTVRRRKRTSAQKHTTPLLVIYGLVALLAVGVVVGLVIYSNG